MSTDSSPNGGDLAAILFAILLLSLLGAGIKYAIDGWDMVLKKASAKHIGTVKWLATLSFLVVIFLMSLLVSTLAGLGGTAKDALLAWLMLNCVNIGAIFCIWTGLPSYWLVNTFLVPIALLQGLLALLATFGSGFQKLAEGSNRFRTTTQWSIFIYHMFLAEILVYRVVGSRASIAYS